MMKRLNNILVALALIVCGSAIGQIQIPGGPIKPPIPPRQANPPKTQKPPMSPKFKYYDVTFTCNVPDASLYIDDKYESGANSVCTLKAGSHVVELYSTCYNDFSTTINVSGNNKSFHFNLIEKTDRNSQSYLGFYYYEGSYGYPQDYAKAVEHFRNAAEQGDI